VLQSIDKIRTDLFIKPKEESEIMTINVIIKHTNPGYPKAVHVKAFDPGTGKSRDIGVIEGGEEKTFAIYAEQSIVLSEITSKINTYQ
jgi:S-adenosylmethionine hydrolase